MTLSSEILLLIRFALAAVFAVAGIAKLRDREGAAQDRRGVRAAGGARAAGGGGAAVRGAGARAAPAAGLRPRGSARSGCSACSTAFTVAMAIALARGKAVDCRCFGQITATPIGPATLVRNVLLAALAAIVVLRGPADVGPGFGAWLSRLSGGEMLNLLLGAIIAAGVFVLVQVLRQYGKLLLRVEALEARGGAAAAPPPPPGLPVGVPAPAFSLKGLDGHPASLKSLGAAGKPVLLVFVEPSCGACDALLPDVAAWQRDHGEKLTVALVSRLEAETRKKVGAHGIRRVLIQKDREVAESFEINATPAAVLVRDGAVASMLAMGPDAIRALVADALLPPPVKEGDEVPVLSARTLDGGALEFSTLRGRVLMLFWNPGCGFCQQMLDGVKRWEGLGSGLKLVVVSSGSEAEIRSQGFASPVVVDDTGGVMRTFNAGGTPSAVLIKDGRIASGVEAGAPNVWKLAGVKQAVPA